MEGPGGPELNQNLHYCQQNNHHKIPMLFIFVVVLDTLQLVCAEISMKIFTC